jgi:single-strand DNA-binding protein
MGTAGRDCRALPHQGRGVAIDGRLEWREYDARDATKRQAIEIVADTVQFLTGPDRGASEQQSAPAATSPAPDDDDIPF